MVVESMERREGRHGPAEVDGHYEVVIVGAGQAGLSMSWWLTERGIGHLVLERDRVARSWVEHRWDSFCLVTPNWQCRLPGHPYQGDDPNGFMVRDQIVDYVRGYADSFHPPVVEGVDVERVSRRGEGGFEVRSSAGTVTAEQVVLAVGGYHRPRVPEEARELPSTLTQLHSSAYRNPGSLPDGAVLVVGSGQSGAQIAEDLHLAGREVHLCVGSAPRVARSYRGRDVVAWLHDIGNYDVPVDDHPEGNDARREPNHYVTGRGGGHDIDLRTFAAEGMRLHGRLIDVDGRALGIAADLADNLDGADHTYERINQSIDEWIEEQGIEAPSGESYEPPWQPPDGAPPTLDLADAGIASVVWATGFHKDWSWVDPPVFDDMGYPDGHRGTTSVPGLYVVGLPWLHTWGSGRFASIGRDTEHVADRIAETAAVARDAA